MSVLGQLTPPWAKVGTDVSAARTAQEALELAGLNWGVEHVAAGIRMPRAGGGSWKKADWLQGVVRTDTWEPLGITGDIHTLVPNVEAFAGFDVLRDMEELRFVSAAEVKGGRMVYLLATLAKPFTIAGEEHETLMILRNQHDGRGGLTAGYTALRLACWNQLPGITAATKSGTNKVGQAFYHLRHTTTVGERYSQAQESLSRAMDLQRSFEEAAGELISRPWSLDDMVGYVEALYPTQGKVAPRTASRNEQRHAEIMAVYEGCTNLENIRPTAYGAFNAVAEWVDHGFAFRATRRASLAENRMLSTMDPQGTAYQLKEKAARLVAKLSAN